MLEFKQFPKSGETPGWFVTSRKASRESQGREHSAGQLGEIVLDAAEQQKKELSDWIPQESRFSSWSETGSKAKWLCRKLRAEQRQRLTLPVLQHPVISDMFPSGLPTAYKNNST